MPPRSAGFAQQRLEAGNFLLGVDDLGDVR